MIEYDILRQGHTNSNIEPSHTCIHKDSHILPPHRTRENTKIQAIISPINMSFNIQNVRSQFPALAESQVFFDNAGGSQTLGTVIEA